MLTGIQITLSESLIKPFHSSIPFICIWFFRDILKYSPFQYLLYLLRKKALLHVHPLIYLFQYGISFCRVAFRKDGVNLLHWGCRDIPDILF